MATAQQTSAKGAAAASSAGGAPASNPMLQNAQQFKDAARALTACANAFADRRDALLHSGDITPTAALASTHDENMLRQQAIMMTAKSVAIVFDTTALAQADLEQAIKDAKDKLAQAAAFETALKFLASLIGLGGAILSGQPMTILSAIDGLKKAVA